MLMITDPNNHVHAVPRPDVDYISIDRDRMFIACKRTEKDKRDGVDPKNYFFKFGWDSPFTIKWAPPPKPWSQRPRYMRRKQISPAF